MNFCASQLGPDISTNKPCTDGYEVSNLVSADNLCRSRGFMGEYFIKPPLDIILRFPVPINISHVLIGAQLRSQCSVGFSLLTQNSTSDPRNNSSNLANTRKNNSMGRKSSSSDINTTEGILQAHGTGVYECGSLVPLQEYEDDEQENDGSSDADVFLCVSNFYTNGEETILLSNSLYRHWFDVPRPQKEKIIEGAQSVYTNNMRHTNREALQYVKKLMVRINKTKHPGPCVLSRLEVWGQPAMSSSIRQRKDLLKKWQGHTISSMSEAPLPRMYGSHKDEESNSSSSQLNSDQCTTIEDYSDIPEEFFDPITCEVMTIPLLLPTGHSVDSQTLERYISNEAQWGRPASDPFSGLAFKDGRGPVPNVTLKARIDRFLLLNGNRSEFKNIGRSLHSTDSFNFNTQSKSPSCSRNNEPSNVEISNSEDGIYKRKHTHLEAERVVEDIDHDISKRKSGLSINSSSSWSTFNSNQLTNLEHKSSSGAKSKRYLHPVNTDRISKQMPTVDDNVPDPGRSRLQMLNQVASLTRPSSSNKSSHLQVASITRPSSNYKSSNLTKPSTSSDLHPITVQNERSISKQSNKAKPNSLTCGDIKAQKFDLDLVLSNSESECSCGSKADLYNLICHHILCKSCVMQVLKDKKVVCLVCGIESQNSQISKHHKKSVFL